MWKTAEARLRRAKSIAEDRLQLTCPLTGSFHAARHLIAEEQRIGYEMPALCQELIFPLLMGEDTHPLEIDRYSHRQCAIGQNQE
jgi:hypothetical protein